jgi:DNA-binding transcriptional LysR family regulator
MRTAHGSGPVAMDLSSLRRFVVIAEELHLGRAAVRTYVSQPALSRMLQTMEREVGAPLAHRDGRSLALTPAGERFAEDASRVLDAFDAAVFRAATAQHDADGLPGEGRLRIGTFYPSAAELTLPILRSFRRFRPDIAVTLVDLTTKRGERALLLGDVDAAFLWSPVASEDLLRVPLFEDAAVAVVAVAHRLAGRDVLQVADLAHESYTVTRGLTERWQAASTLGPWTHRAGKGIGVATVTDALLTIARSDAVTVGPLSLSRHAPVSGLRYVLLADAPAPVSLVCARRTDGRNSVRDFLAVASATAQALPRLVPGARSTGPDNLGADD